MKRILLDTNIYISAILFGGKPKEIINLVREGKFVVIISEYIFWEIREVLSRKFKVPDQRLNTIERDILSLAKLIKIESKLDVLINDPADNEILACGVDGHVEAIISGDKRLLGLKNYGDILLLSPDRFMKSFR